MFAFHTFSDMQVPVLFDRLHVQENAKKVPVFPVLMLYFVMKIPWKHQGMHSLWSLIAQHNSDHWSVLELCTLYTRPLHLDHLQHLWTRWLHSNHWQSFLHRWCPTADFHWQSLDSVCPMMGWRYNSFRIHLFALIERGVSNLLLCNSQWTKAL